MIDTANNGGKIVVSVVCTAYNHEKYIRDALEGFVSQQTNYAYKVFVHDDASTDGTADIIREYEQKYPQLIEGIYQHENQYSQGIKIFKTFVFPRINSEYIALCEGDDYWIDPLKLQKQVDALELHPEINICATGAICVDSSTKKQIGKISPSKNNTILSVADVINGGGGYVATNTLLYRTKILRDPPEFYKKFTFDYTLQICGSLNAGMLFLSDFTSAYRYLAEGSWTESMSWDLNKKVSHEKRVLSMLSVLDIDTEYRYMDTIYLHKLKVFLQVLEDRGDLGKLFTNEYRNLIRHLDLKTKIKLWMKVKCPALVRIKRNIIHKI